MRYSTETWGGGDTSWLASAHGIANSRTSTVKASDFTKATHYPDGYLPSGLPVDATDEKALKPWTGTGKLGFVLFDQSIRDGETIAVPVLRHGSVRIKHLPVSFTTPADQAEFVFIEGSDA